MIYQKSSLIFNKTSILPLSVELIITDYYGLFKYHAYKTIPESFEYYHLIEVRYINEDECIFFTSFIYNNNIFLSEKEVQEKVLSRKRFYSMEKKITF